MSISTQCPHCEAQIRAPDTAAGKKVKCPKCQQAIKIPAPPPRKDKPDVVHDEPAPVPKIKSAPAREKPTRAGKRQTRPAQRGKSALPLVLGIAGGALALLLLAVGGIIWYVTRDKAPGPIAGGPNPVPTNPLPTNPRPPEPSVIELTADQFYLDWKKDPKTAKKRFGNSSIQLSGVIASIGPKDFSTSNHATVLLKVANEQYLFVHCETEDAEPWTQVSLGQEVKVKGVFQENYGYAIVERCTFVDLQPKPTPTPSADQLESEYTANPAAVAEKYDGKILVVSGVLASKSADANPQLILKTSGGVQVIFKLLGGQTDALGRVQVGQQVKVFGFFRKSVQVEKCCILSDCRLLQ